MNSNTPILWQPTFTFGYELRINLSQTFARSMIKSVVAKESRERMNELANEDLKRFKINWRDPYSFYKDSGFIDQIYLGRNGVWLSTDHRNITDLLSEKNLVNSITYNSHNVDFMHEAYALMYLFDKWIEYSDALRAS